MSSPFNLSISVPAEWGKHLKVVIITIVIVVAVALGVDINGLPFRV
ncbi:hypothetical protein ACIBHY_29955 [Nonomuraea sp. NPDC050547]